MKKSIFLSVILFSFIPFFCSAQLNFGLKTGQNISFLNTKNSTAQLFVGDVRSVPQFYYHIGAVTNWTLNEKQALQTELLYQLKGGSRQSHIDALINGQDIDVDFAFRSRFSFLSLPILYQYKLTEQLRLHAGGQVSYRLKTLIKTEPNDEGWSEFNEDIFEERDFDYGALVGLGYQINNLVVELRYSHSFGRFFEAFSTDDNGNPTGDIYDSLRTIQVSASYFFSGL